MKFPADPVSRRALTETDTLGAISVITRERGFIF